MNKLALALVFGLQYSAWAVEMGKPMTAAGTGTLTLSPDHGTVILKLRKDMGSLKSMVYQPVIKQEILDKERLVALQAEGRQAHGAGVSAAVEHLRSILGPSDRFTISSRDGADEETRMQGDQLATYRTPVAESEVRVELVGAEGLFRKLAAIRRTPGAFDTVSVDAYLGISEERLNAEVARAHDEALNRAAAAARAKLKKGSRLGEGKIVDSTVKWRSPMVRSWLPPLHKVETARGLRQAATSKNAVTAEFSFPVLGRGSVKNKRQERDE